MPKLLYQGHGNYRLTSNNGRTVYVDPYKGKGYDAPADIILVTHQHFDHNNVKRCIQKPGCRVISNVEALAGGVHNSFDIDGIMIQAVEANNKKHDPELCVGYIITIDGIKVYASGDTSMTAQMSDFAAMRLDYALFPGGGIYNMGLAEAAECARLVSARHNILIHLKPWESVRRKAGKWDAPNKLIVVPGQEIDL
jgi:L-ascorbate metabolism protein UlaG (beta-lactamase superfamily)